MRMRKRFMLLLGSAYRQLYRVPVAGDAAVRAIGRGIALLGRCSPYRMRDGASADALKRDLERALKAMDIDFQELRESEGKLELVLAKCPYGFDRPEHVGVCDAAMEQDRAMLRHVGASLTIEESIPEGAPACRVFIYPSGLSGRSPT